MFVGLKDIFRKHKLKKLSSTIPTWLVPLKDIHSATVVFDRYDENLTEGGRKIEKFFTDNGISSSFIIIDTAKKAERKRLVAPEIPDFGKCTEFTSKELNWFGMPKLKTFGGMLMSETDLLVNLSVSEKFPSAFISAVSRSRMKVGVTAYPGNPFDITFTEKTGSQPTGPDATATDNVRTGDKIDAIIKFLRQII